MDKIPITVVMNMGKLKYVNDRDSLLFDNFVWLKKKKKKAILIEKKSGWQTSVRDLPCRSSG